MAKDNLKKWNFWGKIKLFCEERMVGAWLDGGNYDSGCPNCQRWESLGNIILTEDMENGKFLRRCNTCEYTWEAIFTPEGFVPIGDHATGEIKRPTIH